ncbi:alpha/beta fold hydrolase, partial [Amycolatopsis solani]|uniref:alpha/beta fold hydrolase n=1 Tax=Amycolatopsis solani TaxID=3028615 RepID=UPI0025AFC004
MTGFALADGTSLQVIRRGDPAAPVTVIFVHGYALDQRSWGRIAPLVPDAAEGPVAVLTYDQRGHGGSGRARRGTATMARGGGPRAPRGGGGGPHGLGAVSKYVSHAL